MPKMRQPSTQGSERLWNLFQECVWETGMILYGLDKGLERPSKEPGVFLVNYTNNPGER